MLSKANIWVICRDHIGTLYSNSYYVETGTKRISPIEIIGFYGTPLVAAYVVTWCMPTIAAKVPFEILITALAIFTGLLVNVLVLLYGMIASTIRQDAAPGDKGATRRLTVMQETFTNIMYATLVAVIAVVTILLLRYYTPTHDYDSDAFKKTVLDLGSYYTAGWYFGVFLLVNFTLTLFMILKRLRFMFSRLPSIPS